MIMSTRILAIDPGEKRIGLAISDPTGMLARPLTVLKHISRDENARRIIQLAEENDVGKIIVGQAFDMDGLPNLSGRKAARLAGAIRAKTTLPVELWDESYTTKEAQQVQRELGVSRKKRRGHLDEHAAAHLLQSYLDHKQDA